MRTSVNAKVRTSCLLVLSAALVASFFSAAPTSANSGIKDAWIMKYGPIPGDADCLLCHLDTPQPWNGYGWDIKSALDIGGCGEGDLDLAFECIEDLNSDMDSGAFTNLDEIIADAQPGWTTPTSMVFFQNGNVDNVPPPGGIDPYDPDGTGGTGGVGGTGGTAGTGGVGGTGGTAGTGGVGGTGGTGGDDCDPGHERIPPGQFKRGTIVVKPGQSIQDAIDRAEENTRIYVLGGVYEEPCNPTNGLNITKSGIHLIGQDNPQKRVIIRSTGDQRNGIVIRPPDVPAAMQPDRPGSEPLKSTDCMGCHTDMGPPFPLHPDVPVVIPTDDDPWIYDIVIESITIQGFRNNGLNTEHVDGFVFDDIDSIDNRNYGIFPVLSKNGVVKNSYSKGSDLDSGLWVETSENVLVQGNVVEGSVNGIEVSNSDDILVIDNEAFDNSIGAAILLLPDIYDNKDSAKRIDLYNNWFHDNNKENTARPGSILSFIPRGQGILYVGVDESVASGNLVERNDFVGIAVVDYCLPFQGTPFDCSVDTSITPEFLADQAAENNTVADNNLVNNGTDPDPGPFQPFAADLTLLVAPPPFPPDHGNCFQNNIFTTEFSTLGVLPPCAE